MSDGEFQTHLYLARYYDNELICGHKTNYMTGVELIAQERLEQKIKHGRTVKSDYELNSDYQLINGAIRLLNGGDYPPPDGWDKETWTKMLNKGDGERYVIAGALIADEIDRLNFENDKG